MLQIPVNGGKRIKPFPPPPLPFSSTFATQSSPYDDHFPQQDTRPSVRALTSGNDAVSKEESFRLAQKFVLNQRVNVNVEGRGWLLGTVVFIAKAVESLTGSMVRVRYSIPPEHHERQSEFPNHPDHIRSA